MDGMVKRQRVLGLIPARGGSKSIPRKNIKLLGGFPLISHSITAAKGSKYLDRIIVSTDDPEIAKVARRWGAEVPFLRPAELAQDDTPDMPVFRHCLQWLTDQNEPLPDIIVQLRPTSPFRPKGAIDEAIETLLQNPTADCIRSVTPAAQNPFKMWQLQNGLLEPLLHLDIKEPFNMPRQKLPVVYWQTGHLDIFYRRTIEEKNSLTGEIVVPYFIPEEYAVDLDTPLQWQYAEFLLRSETLQIEKPGELQSQLLQDVRLLVLDFDGVMTDNMVSVSANGDESVRCSRADGLGIAMLKKTDVTVLVLSTEKNAVVQARCKKLDIPCFAGIENKREALEKILQDYHIRWSQTAYVGNDLNDREVMSQVGVAIAVADAHEEILSLAHIVLSSRGGHGAVREIIEKLIHSKKRRIL